MTKHQYKLCKLVIRYKHLDKILNHSKLSNEGGNAYIQLQELLNCQLVFENINDDHTIVTLSTPLQEEFEHRRQDNVRWIATSLISLIALIKSFMPELTAVAASIWKLLMQ